MLKRLIDDTVECPSVRVRNAVERIENLLKKVLFCLLFTGSRYIFLRVASKKTRTDGVGSVCQTLISVSVSSSTQRSGVYRELVEKNDTCVYYSPVLDTFFSALLRKKTRTDGAAVFVRY